MTLVTRVKGPDGVVLVEGEAQIQAPEAPVYLNDIEVPDLQVQKHRHFDAMLELAQSLDPLPVAVVAPDDPNSLGGALLARDEGLIKPILVGSKTRIEQAARPLEYQSRIWNSSILRMSQPLRPARCRWCMRAA